MRHLLRSLVERSGPSAAVGCESIWGATQILINKEAPAATNDGVRLSLGVALVTSTAPGWDKPHHPTPCDSWHDHPRGATSFFPSAARRHAPRLHEAWNVNPSEKCRQTLSGRRICSSASIEDLDDLDKDKPLGTWAEDHPSCRTGRTRWRHSQKPEIQNSRPYRLPFDQVQSSLESPKE